MNSFVHHTLLKLAAQYVMTSNECVCMYGSIITVFLKPKYEFIVLITTGMRNKWGGTFISLSLTPVIKNLFMLVTDFIISQFSLLLDCIFISQSQHPAWPQD